MNFSCYLLNRKHKNSHFQYFLKNFLSYVLPDFLFRERLPSELAKLDNYDANYILSRVNYYNKLENISKITENAVSVGDFRLRLKQFKPHTHFFDTYEYVRFFPVYHKMALLFGDIRHIPSSPSIVKSRPVAGDNKNAIMFKLGKLRHFMFVKDTIPFPNKKNMLLGRCSVYQPWRVKFWEMYFGHPLCDLGQVNKVPVHNKNWLVSKMPVDEHLDYKFILALEGNDVASNLKWIMSSNSLAVLPKPTYETWFMEGKLIPDYHYIAIKKDYSDLPEKLNYYIKNTEAALRIVDNAHKYVEQFRDENREKLISLLVLKKYFDYVK
ncbi:MAG: hypothetical protein LBR56_00390 [Sporomusaceae bacterium]|jgi:hypothetical protein|nr:hypothetical protein [Sporomusaceae bacterium]